MQEQSPLLPDDYTIKILDDAEFTPLFRQYRPLIFSNSLDFNVRQALSAEELSARDRLAERMGNPFTLHIGIYYHDEFVGWSTGVQHFSDRFYMMNTGILPQHQGKGIYSALLPYMLGILKQQGFQIVYSRHIATNNQVLVPKLKAGFIITGFEISDIFGLLVHLSYFFNPVRRKVMDVRAGQMIPDEEVWRYLGLS